MNLKCASCEKTESILWRKNSENGEVCNDCYESEKSDLQVKQEKEESAEKEAVEDAVKDVVVKEAVPEAKIRKSTRSTRFKNKAISRQKSKVSRKVERVPLHYNRFLGDIETIQHIQGDSTDKDANQHLSRNEDKNSSVRRRRILLSDRRYRVVKVPRQEVLRTNQIADR